MDDVRARVAEIEVPLRRMPGVRFASVKTDERGRISEVHLVTDGGKPAKAFVRDVQAVLSAQFGLEIDHRAVSVVEIPGEPVPAAGAGGDGTGGDDGIRRIPGVRQVSMVTDPYGRVIEVHVVSRGGRPATAIVRDVQAALASLGYDVDHRVVSVVEIPDGAPDSGQPTPSSSGGAGRGGPRTLVGTPDPDPDPDSGGEDSIGSIRPALTSIQVVRHGSEVTVTVTLTLGQHVLTGRADGPSGPAHRSLVVAQATRAALVELLGVVVTLESAQIVDAGRHRVAVAVLALEIPRLGQQVLVGSALVRGDEEDAVARAVLAALNRRLAG